MASSSSTPPPPPEKDVDASETETLTFNVQNVDGKPCTSISAPGGVLVVSGECVAMNNMFGGLSITAIVDTAGTQIITIPGVCWTVGGSIPDGLVITGEAITTDGGKLKIETKISIKAPAAVGASVSKDVKVISEKFVVGVRLNGTFNSKIMSCWKREGDAILRIADQEFFHVSKLPVGGLNVLINTLRRQWGEHSNPTLVFRVQCDASYNSRATKTILNLLGFPIRDDLPGTKTESKHAICPKFLIDTVAALGTVDFSTLQEFLVMFDWAKFTYISDVEAVFSAGDVQSKQYFVKCCDADACRTNSTKDEAEKAGAVHVLSDKSVDSTARLFADTLKF